MNDLGPGSLKEHSVEKKSVVEHPAQATGKKLAEEHPARTEDAKQSAASGRSHPRRRSRRPFHAGVAAGSQSGSEPSPNRRPASTVSRPSTPEITDSTLGIADRQSDRRPSTLEFAAE
ncbi:hypothetical protein B296_00035795 [Ensete ventricosum]|uniref:Uncharacterized protein n=1 Tax=Ensete ventricosum TaxID=4639 RepID=A0A426ZWP2_ENSVE|nr:hypothetical protein B296_00035795 [Ensete ventricosum]